MDEFDTNCFDKKIYLVLFRLGSKVDDKAKPFDLPIVAAYIGFEGESAQNFQGLRNSTIKKFFELLLAILIKRRNENFPRTS